MTDSPGGGDSRAAESHAAFKEGCVVVRRPSLGFVELTGEDRARFLNGMVTCDVAALAPGEGVYGFFTDVKGRVLSDAVVQATPDTLRVRLEASAAGPIAEHLSRYIIADRVEVRELSGRQVWSLAGSAAAERLAAAGAQAPDAAWSHGETELAAGPGVVSRDPRFGETVIDLDVADEHGATLAASLGGETPGAAAAFETLRVESGVPRFGQDFDSEHLPQETGREEAVSYTKGCYLGQEVVARVHYLGEPPRVLCGLRLDGESPPELPMAVRHEGREAGALTSAARSEQFGGPIGLAILKRRATAPGTGVELGDGSSAEASALPFAPHSAQPSETTEQEETS